MGRSSSSSVAVKKQSADWSSSGWDADDSWSNEKDGQGQSSAGEEGWGNDWGEEDTDTTLTNATLPLPEGVRLASEYNWDSGSSGTKGSSQNDLFASVSQRNTAGTAATTVRTERGKNTEKLEMQLVFICVEINRMSETVNSESGETGKMQQKPSVDRDKNDSSLI